MTKIWEGAVTTGIASSLNTQGHAQYTYSWKMTQRHQSVSDISVMFVSKHRLQGLACMESCVTALTQLSIDLYGASFHAFLISTSCQIETKNESSVLQ